MLKRSKKLREYFETKTDENFAAKYMSKNWHFLTSFEYFLYNLVRNDEITSEFNNLTKITAPKIENYIISKVDNYVNFSELEQNIHCKFLFFINFLLQLQITK